MSQTTTATYVTNGLNSNEAAERLAKFGSNTITIHESNAFQLFIKQLASPLIYCLIFAALVSFYVGDTIDAAVILLVISINTIIGFGQEYKAKQKYEKLKSFITSEVSVIRDARKQSIDKSQLVPGDVILYKLGDIVAADCYIINANELIVDESSITGESVNVSKQPNPQQDSNKSDGLLYSGTYIVKGTTTAIVFATGADSKFGHISHLTINTTKQSEYEINLRKLTRGFLVASIVFLAVILIAHIALKPNTDLVTTLLFIVALGVSIIPESLPVVTTVALAENALSLGKKGVIVKRIAAIEDLGNLDIICTDKTGTLTQNKMEVKKWLSADVDKLNKYSWLSSNSSTDPFDFSIYNFLKTNNWTENRTDYIEIPFNPELKYSGRKFTEFTVIKGAPEYIVSASKNIESVSQTLNEIDKVTEQGYRPISVGLQSHQDAKLEYLGTYFLIDQVKPGVADVIRQANKAGIQIKIITGDALQVGIFVGKEVKLIKEDSEAIDVKDLAWDDEKEFVRQVNKYEIFCRADPEQKYKIIKALQTEHEVGYLGDGINDAPSIKLANVGMVVNNASDIAKATADIIILTRSLDVIVEGIIQGRRVFENIDKYIKHTLTGNFGNFFTIGLLSVFIDFLPMLPIQILLANILTDLPALAFANDNVDPQDVHKPLQHNIGRLIKFTLVLGLISSIFDFIFFAFSSNRPVPETQAMWFIFSTITELLVIFSLRTNRFFLKASKPSQTLTIVTMLAIGVTLIMPLVGVSILGITQLPLITILGIFAISLLYLIANELVKVQLYKNLHQNIKRHRSMK